MKAIIMVVTYALIGGGFVVGMCLAARRGDRLSREAREGSGRRRQDRTHLLGDGTREEAE